MGAWIATSYKKYNLAQQCFHALADNNPQYLHSLPLLFSPISPLFLLFDRERQWLTAMAAVEGDQEVMASDSSLLLLKIGSRVRSAVSRKLVSCL
jgi:hypothetical protein